MLMLHIKLSKNNKTKQKKKNKKKKNNIQSKEDGKEASFLLSQSSCLVRKRERKMVAYLSIYLVSCDCYCSVALLHGAVGRSAVCNCGNSLRRQCIVPITQLRRLKVKAQFLDNGIYPSMLCLI